jgi:hypothetical protein
MAPAYFVYLLKAYCFQPIPVPVENGHVGKHWKAMICEWHIFLTRSPADAYTFFPSLILWQIVKIVLM